MKNRFLLLLLLGVNNLFSQTVEKKLDKAVKSLLRDVQLKHAITGFEVVDSKTGKVVYAYNEQVGLAPASTQKIFTSIAVFDLLGRDYRYRTSFGYIGTIKDTVLNGNLYLLGSGDPSLGSWRWIQTDSLETGKKIVNAVQELKIKAITGDFLYHNSKFSLQAIPDGWIWQDIGNYYGAGAFDINWKENQYELHLASGNKIGEEVNFNRHVDYNYHGFFRNELVSAEKGSGDNAYIYLGTENAYPLLKGTIPIAEKDFTISGANPNPPYSLVEDIKSRLLGRGIHFTKQNGLFSTAPVTDIVADSIKNGHELISLISPPFDSLNFWFLRKSINLYGEAFLKTIALEKEGYASTEKGVELLKKFWEDKGVENAALNIVDGCGLSPQNRVTADALVNALQYARTRNWYASFYNALPEYNGMKLKSGSINGARAYAGYHVSKTNKSYTFAIIINNYDGPPSDTIKKMFIVLDILK